MKIREFSYSQSPVISIHKLFVVNNLNETTTRNIDYNIHQPSIDELETESNPVFASLLNTIRSSSRSRRNNQKNHTLFIISNAANSSLISKHTVDGLMDEQWIDTLFDMHVSLRILLACCDCCGNSNHEKTSDYSDIDEYFADDGGGDSKLPPTHTLIIPIVSCRHATCRDGTQAMMKEIKRIKHTNSIELINADDYYIDPIDGDKIKEKVDGIVARIQKGTQAHYQQLYKYHHHQATLYEHAISLNGGSADDSVERTLLSLIHTNAKMALIATMTLESASTTLRDLNLAYVLILKQAENPKGESLKGENPMAAMQKSDALCGWLSKCAWIADVCVEGVLGVLCGWSGEWKNAAMYLQGHIEWFSGAIASVDALMAWKSALYARASQHFGACNHVYPPNYGYYCYLAAIYSPPSNNGNGGRVEDKVGSDEYFFLQAIDYFTQRRMHRWALLAQRRLLSIYTHKLCVDKALLLIAEIKTPNNARRGEIHTAPLLSPAMQIDLLQEQWKVEPSTAIKLSIAALSPHTLSDWECVGGAASEVVDGSVVGDLLVCSILGEEEHSHHANDNNNPSIALSIVNQSPAILYADHIKCFYTISTHTADGDSSDHSVVAVDGFSGGEGEILPWIPFTKQIQIPPAAPSCTITVTAIEIHSSRPRKASSPIDGNGLETGKLVIRIASTHFATNSSISICDAAAGACKRVCSLLSCKPIGSLLRLEDSCTNASAIDDNSCPRSLACILPFEISCMHPNEADKDGLWLEIECDNDNVMVLPSAPTHNPSSPPINTAPLNGYKLEISHEKLFSNAAKTLTVPIHVAPLLLRAGRAEHNTAIDGDHMNGESVAITATLRQPPQHRQIDERTVAQSTLHCTLPIHAPITIQIDTLTRSTPLSSLNTNGDDINNITIEYRLTATVTISALFRERIRVIGCRIVGDDAQVHEHKQRDSSRVNRTDGKAGVVCVDDQMGVYSVVCVGVGADRFDGAESADCRFLVDWCANDAAFESSLPLPRLQFTPPTDRPLVIPVHTLKQDNVNNNAPCTIKVGTLVPIEWHIEIPHTCFNGSMGRLDYKIESSVSVWLGTLSSSIHLDGGEGGTNGIDTGNAVPYRTATIKGTWMPITQKKNCEWPRILLMNADGDLLHTAEVLEGGGGGPVDIVA